MIFSTVFSVTVVIPVFNGELFLREALESVLNQNENPDEIVVVDDGSTDSTSAIIDGYGEKLRSIRTANRGVAAARNAGVDAARGRYVAFLDADDRWYPEKIRVYKQQAAQHPAVGLFFSDAFSISENGQPIRLIHRPPPPGRFFETLLQGNYVETSTAMIRRDVWPTVGHFREDFQCRAGVEDWEFFLRMARGWPGLYIARCLTEYRIHPTSSIQTNRRVLREDALRVLALHGENGGVPLNVHETAEANVYYESGVRHIAVLDLREARRDLRKSLRNSRFFFRSLALLMATVWGRGMVRWLLRVRRWFFQSFGGRMSKRPGSGDDRLTLPG